MSAKHQQCTGRGCVTCAQRAESSAKLSPSTSLRNDGCAACDNRAHPEMNKEEGQVNSPIHQLTSNHAGGYLASNTNANNNYNHVISNVVTTTEVTMQAQRPVSQRARRPVNRYADGAAAASLCDVRRGLDFVCDGECECSNSVPKTHNERVTNIRGLDVDPNSWGVVARRVLAQGEIATVFGDTSFVHVDTREGREFDTLHKRLASDNKPLQYSFQYHLAGDSTGKYWAIPGDDRAVVCEQQAITR